MIWLASIALLILILGPARPFVFANLRFFLPATVGGILGLLFASWVLSMSKTGMPWPWVALLYGAVLGFLEFGHGFKDWMDRTFDHRD